MKLALAIGYSGATLDVPIELIQHAERLGFDSVWTAEAYGSDAITPLAWIAAKTERIRLGTGIMQLAGRATGDVRDAVHDRRRARRRRPHDRRARRLRPADRRGLVRAAVGQAVLAAARLHRDHAQDLRARGARRPRGPRDLPAVTPAPGATGLGKPLRSIIHGDPKLPIWMGSGKEATVRLTAELCDGWLPMHFVPGRLAEYRPWLEEGFARARAAGRDKGWHNFEIQAQVGVRITDDVAGALAAQKPGIALYVGGMGAREVNFHNQHMRRMGYADAAERIQELFLAGRKDEAIAAVPDDYVDERCLVGPVVAHPRALRRVGRLRDHRPRPHDAPAAGARGARRVRPRAPGPRRRRGHHGLSRTAQVAWRADGGVRRAAPRAPSLVVTGLGIGQRVGDRGVPRLVRVQQRRRRVGGVRVDLVGRHRRAAHHDSAATAAMSPGTTNDGRPVVSATNITAASGTR